LKFYSLHSENICLFELGKNPAYSEIEIKSIETDSITQTICY